MDYAIFEPSNVEESCLAGITVAVLEERVTNHVQFFWTVVAFLVAWLGVGTYFFGDMRGDVKVLLRPQNLTKAASTPTNPKSQALVKKIIADAKNGPPITQTVVQQSASRFVEAAAKDNSAWPVATDLVSYRTTLNSDLLEVGTAEEIATTPDFNEGPIARFFNAPPPFPGARFYFGW